MNYERAQVSENGRIVIPATFRKAMGIKGGDVMTVRMDEEGLHLETVRQSIRRARAIVRKYVSADRCLSDELIAERKREAKREAEEFG